MAPRSRRILFLTLAAIAPLVVLAQLPLRATPQQQAALSTAQSGGAGRSWADDVLAKEGYVTPPKELADAVLAPRHLNVTLSNLSPDKKWFLDEIEDGPVVMKTFAKPFDELGGAFIDYKANRARS